jgi:hypothetical protein
MSVFTRMGAVVVCAAASGALAGPVVFGLDHEFSGATAPDGTGPWLIATFAQTGADEVTLTMDATPLTTGGNNGLNSDSKVKDWYFNVADESKLASMSITYGSGQAAQSVSKSANAYQADGDGKYDILFSFASGGANAFTGSETSVYTITATGITPEWFLALSQPAGGHGPFYTAAHVLGLGDDGDDSGWLAPTMIPLPTSAAMAGVGLLALGARRRRDG